MKKVNNTLNLLKGLACMGVVFIHVNFPGELGQIVIALARSAVALFFLISGYYLYWDDPKEIDEKMPKKLKNIGLIAIWAFIFYFLWESFVRLWGSGWQSVSDWYINDLFTWESLVKFVLLSYDPVVGHLWFLVALLEAYLVFWLINKLRIADYSWILAVILLEVHVVVMTLSTLFSWGLDMTIFRSMWFYGLPFLILGYSIKRREESINLHIKTLFLVCLAVIGIGATIVERVFIGNLQIFQGTIIFTLSIFIIAVRFPGARYPKSLILLGAKYSSHIYIYHWFVKELFIKLQEILSLDSSWFDWVEPFGVFIVTLIGVIALLFVKKLLKKLIGKAANRSKV